MPFYQAKLTSPDVGEALSNVIFSIRDLENGGDLRVFGRKWSGPLEGTGGNDVMQLAALLAPETRTAGGLGGDDYIGGTIHGDGTYGGRGHDVLDGNDGRDRLFGGAGDDLIAGGGDGDIRIGGNGDDRLFGGNEPGSFYLSWDHGDLIFGGDGDDFVDGGGGNDVLRGEAGHDTLAGNRGGDTLIGGKGDDVLHGGGLGDLLFGGDGSDFMNGGFGHDRMNGGGGGDRFFHQGSAGHGSDWLQDYDAAEGDVLIFASSATRDDFQINIAATNEAGVSDVNEAFIIHRPTGQIVWALVDGAAQDEINLQIGHEVFDLTA